MVSFFVAGIQRSGTTYIRRCIDSHSMIRCHGEVFQTRYRDTGGYYDYLAGSSLRRMMHVLHRRTNVMHYLEYLDANSEAPCVGLKLMRSQVRKVPYRFPMLLDYIKNEQVKVIQIIRNNVLKTYLSRLSTQISGRYHAKTDVNVEKLSVDTSSILDELDHVRAENEWWQSLLGKVGHIEVEYEKFVLDKEYESRRILNYLGVGYEELHSSNKKINPDDVASLVLNYRELEKVLAGSRYAYCLKL